MFVKKCFELSAIRKLYMPIFLCQKVFVQKSFLWPGGFYNNKVSKVY
jgi:hypothetical protein